MNNKQNETHHTQPNEPHTPPEQDGGGEYTTPQLYGANTPSSKKIKKFQKIKNSKVITYKITNCQN